MNPVNIYDAKARRSEKPAARLVALATPPERRPGGWEGSVWVAPDFDKADATIAALLLGGDGPE